MGPYNYHKYFNLPKPSPEYESRTPFEPVPGTTIDDLDYYRRIREEAEEAMKKEYWLDNQGGLHGNSSSAWNTSMGYESIKGEKDCTGGSEV